MPQSEKQDDHQLLAIPSSANPHFKGLCCTQDINSWKKIGKATKYHFHFSNELLVQKGKKKEKFARAVFLHVQRQGEVSLCHLQIDVIISKTRRPIKNCMESNMQEPWDTCRSTLFIKSRMNIWKPGCINRKAAVPENNRISQVTFLGFATNCLPVLLQRLEKFNIYVPKSALFGWGSQHHHQRTPWESLPQGIHLISGEKS